MSMFIFGEIPAVARHTGHEDYIGHAEPTRKEPDLSGYVVAFTIGFAYRTHATVDIQLFLFEVPYLSSTRPPKTNR